MKVKILTFGLLILFSSIVFAQQDSLSIYDLSLEQLLNMPVTTGNVKEKNIRETPGIISVINADDIKKTGARDLIDLLQMTPGIQFGSDIQNYVGIGMRGLWCSEGRVALFIDDVEYNDLGYGTVPFGNHFPLDQIEKIEIIRGPGSSMYGGTAQYGVIKITTKKGSLNGAEVSSTLGQDWKEMNIRYDNWIPRRNFNLQIGKKCKNGSVYASGFTGQTQRSSGDYIDFYSGEKYSFENASQLNTYSLLLNANYKDIDASFWFDNYSNQGRDLYGQANLTTTTTRYFTMAGVLKYEKKFSDKFTLKPMFSYKMQNPWYTMDTLTIRYISDRRLTRLNPRLDLIYSPVSNIDIGVFRTVQ
jgi:outer membrane cobalamin receptor